MPCGGGGDAVQMMTRAKIFAIILDYRYDLALNMVMFKYFG